MTSSNPQSAIEWSIAFGEVPVNTTRQLHASAYLVRNPDRAHPSDFFPVDIVPVEISTTVGAIDLGVVSNETHQLMVALLQAAGINTPEHLSRE